MTRRLPPEARPLRVPGADWAVLDLPTGRLQIERGHNAVMGNAAELRKLAAAINTACERAEQSAAPALSPAGFLHILEHEGI